MSDTGNRPSPYRWVVLIVFICIAAVNQVLWITFAPITSAAMTFYSTSDLVIGLLSMIFMIVYIVVVIPAAWAIDTWGLRKAVGLGALFTGVFAVVRGIFADNLTVVLIAQVGIALGQPLILGAITTVASRWFPLKERATAAGLGTLSVYLGVLAGMFITPSLVTHRGIAGMLLIYGIAAAVAAALFLGFARERPAVPGTEGTEMQRALMFDGLKEMLRSKDFLLVLVIFFIGLGMFNGVTTWIEEIVRPRGFSTSQAGILGGVMFIGGIIGAIVIPIISDIRRRRKPFILLALVGVLPGLAALTFTHNYAVLLAAGAWFGFFLLSAGPIGFQYGAEITHPAPEGTSNSMILGMGQISGILFIIVMDALKSPSGAMTPSLLLLLGLTVAAALLAVLLRRSPIAEVEAEADR